MSDRTKARPTAKSPRPGRTQVSEIQIDGAGGNPFITLLGHMGRFAMIESVARQLDLSLEDAQPLLEAAINQHEPITFDSMIGYVRHAVEGERWDEESKTYVVA